MARVFDKVDEWEVYVPFCERAAFVNDASEAFTVEIRFLVARERRELDRRIMAAVERDASGAAAVAEAMARRLFCENVRNIRNYSPNGTEIKTSELLFDEGEPDIVNEIEGAMRNRSLLDGGLAKKLRPPLAC